MLDARALAYRRLLADPCNGPLVSPVALGPTTGLLARQRYYVRPTFSTSAQVAAATIGSVAAVFNPATGNFTYVAHAAGITDSNTSVDLETGILASSVCHAYRPVAACVKWIPTGAISSRAGVVATGYVADRVTLPSNPFGIDRFQAMCQHTVSNTGSGMLPEVRWVPSGPEDLEFRARGVTYNADSGTCAIIARDVDKTTGSSGTTTHLNGYFEVTVVWEWVPDSESGIAATVQAGSTSTIAQVLGSLGDLTRFVIDGGYASRLMGAAASYATTAIMGRAVNSLAASPMLLA
jgi:hypothetical protein